MQRANLVFFGSRFSFRLISFLAGTQNDVSNDVYVVLESVIYRRLVGARKPLSDYLERLTLSFRPRKEKIETRTHVFNLPFEKLLVSLGAKRLRRTASPVS